MADNKKSLKQKVSGEVENGARKKVLEDLFYDFNRSRSKVYLMNFFRGVFFGFGSIIGATIVVAIFIWIMSLFTEIPGIGDFFEFMRQSVKSGK